MTKDNLSKMALTTSENKKKNQRTKKNKQKSKAGELVCCWCFSVLISVN